MRMALTIEEVTSHLKALIQFYKTFHSLGNSHFGSFFTAHLWETEVPPEIQSELNNITSINNFIELYPEIIKSTVSYAFAENHPNLTNFLKTALRLSINKEEKYLKLLQNLENLCISKGHTKTSDIEMEIFMSQKKFHEVKMTSKMAAIISKITKSSHIVDIGGGKGYLSCVLALHHCFKVLGLDSSEVTTCGAVKRSQKVAKMWNADLFKLPKFDQKISSKKDRENFIQNHYKQLITFVKPETDVEELLRKAFKEEITGITLTGLHTCGDLSPTSLEMFVNNKNIRGILNIGCCYNNLNEKYCSDNCEKKPENHGFPMSSLLKSEEYWLGRNARMLAAHSLDRIDSNLDFEFSQTSIFYRAILETVISKENKNDRTQHVGRLAKKCRNFREYMLTALEKLGRNDELTETDINRLYEQYIDKKPLLTAFYLLRISLAPIVESIILLDRILFLMENGISNVYLVPLFDLEISPRGFGIIAWKDFDNSYCTEKKNKFCKT